MNKPNQLGLSNVHSHVTQMALMEGVSISMKTAALFPELLDAN